MKCFEHFFEPSPNELAAFKLVAKFLQESNLKGIGIFLSNITVITLNKFRKRARGLLRTRISSLDFRIFMTSHENNLITSPLRRKIELPTLTSPYLWGKWRFNICSAVHYSVRCYESCLRTWIRWQTTMQVSPSILTEGKRVTSNFVFLASIFCA